MSELPFLWTSDEVAAAITAGRAVVALESSLIAQGLPPPHNLETAAAAEGAIRDEGAIPATVAIDGGRLLVGAPQAVLDRLADPAGGAAKAASRDIGPLLASGRLASTTVSATMRIAAMAGLRLFATGGVGGVHRGAGASFDVSSDVDELAATRVAVLCSGAKSILDLPATLELLETRRVPVVGLGVDELPAFYSMSSGLRVPHRVETVAEAAAVISAHFALPGSAGILIVQPPPAEVAIPVDEVEGWITAATSTAAGQGLRGGAVTPSILARLAELSNGRTLRANIGLILNNARTAARIAVSLADGTGNAST
jgi:pseudouridine-5'-phosphate glycosidase